MSTQLCGIIAIKRQLSLSDASLEPIEHRALEGQITKFQEKETGWTLSSMSVSKPSLDWAII